MSIMKRIPKVRTLCDMELGNDKESIEELEIKYREGFFMILISFGFFIPLLDLVYFGLWQFGYLWYFLFLGMRWYLHSEIFGFIFVIFGLQLLRGKSWALKLAEKKTETLMFTGRLMIIIGPLCFLYILGRWPFYYDIFGILYTAILCPAFVIFGWQLLRRKTWAVIGGTVLSFSQSLFIYIFISGLSYLLDGPVEFLRFIYHYLSTVVFILMISQAYQAIRKRRLRIKTKKKTGTSSKKENQELEKKVGESHIEERTRTKKYPSEMQKSFEYDITISYASENRKIAEELAEKLQNKGVRVFYDKFRKAELWGKKLMTYFQDAYGPKTKYVVPLISRHYPIKDWTDFEFSIMRTEAKKRQNEFILPVKLDDTEILGIRRDIGYLDYKEEGIDSIIDCLLEKLSMVKDV